ncbi:hypothetical protein E1I18_01425 [Mycoplasmopsis mucosicanis]|uniref:Lipoprotein n=1 Tax=Mycoplasmopsis mucosicanis TaxID=458208 RepID=A0A507SQ89_9BACT|nr:hypothetical protein [Mycoplasmopsis mucosicanis]TQC53967.1 hypothetical protein E1I18_01425 [Mycoplasmopsis mucosicanis]
MKLKNLMLAPIILAPLSVASCSIFGDDYESDKIDSHLRKHAYFWNLYTDFDDEIIFRDLNAPKHTTKTFISEKNLRNNEYKNYSLSHGRDLIVLRKVGSKPFNLNYNSYSYGSDSPDYYERFHTENINGMEVDGRKYFLLNLGVKNNSTFSGLIHNTSWAIKTGAELKEASDNLDKFFNSVNVFIPHDQSNNIDLYDEVRKKVKGWEKVINNNKFFYKEANKDKKYFVFQAAILNQWIWSRLDDKPTTIFSYVPMIKNGKLTIQPYIYNRPLTDKDFEQGRYIFNNLSRSISYVNYVFDLEQLSKDLNIKESEFDRKKHVFIDHKNYFKNFEESVPKNKINNVVELVFYLSSKFFSKKGISSYIESSAVDARWDGARFDTEDH